MTRREDLDALEQRLARAWREDDGPELDAEWKSGLMRAIRDAAAEKRAEAEPSFERLVGRAWWIAASIAAVTLLGFATQVVTFDPSSELARLFASDPQTLLQLFLVL